LQHFGIFEGDGDEHAGRTGRLAFAMASGGPAEFAAASGTGNDAAGVGWLYQKHLDRENPIISQQAKRLFGEIGIFKGHDGIPRGIR
jgi:hypothetical protein